MTAILIIPAVLAAWVISTAIVAIADVLGLVYTEERERRRHAGEEVRLADHVR